MTQAQNFYLNNYGDTMTKQRKRSGSNSEDHGKEATTFKQRKRSSKKSFLDGLLPDNINLTINICGNSTCTENKCNDTWINIYEKGHYQGPHWHVIGDEDEEPEYKGHPQNLFCFTYFMKYDEEKDAKFKFTDRSSGSSPFEEEWKKEVLTFTRSFIPDVKQGDVIIFPFFMVHEVSKQECNGPRITFSGNLYKEI